MLFAAFSKSSFYACNSCNVFAFQILSVYIHQHIIVPVKLLPPEAEIAVFLACEKALSVCGGG